MDATTSTATVTVTHTASVIAPLNPYLPHDHTKLIMKSVCTYASSGETHLP